MITSWEYLQDCRLPIILYGMGDGADKIIDRLKSIKLQISDVMASDAFVRGQSFHGFKVKTLSQVEDIYGDFVIVLAFASSLPEVTEHIRAVSKKHRLLAPSVPVAGENIFDRAFARKHSSELQSAFELLADEESRRVYELIINFMLTGEIDLLFAAETPKSEAFENILKLAKDENYFDIGAYRGDTIGEFLFFSNNTVPPKDEFKGSITAFEPDIKNFAKLRAYAENFPNTVLFQKGIWSKDGIIKFAARAGRNSSLNSAGRDIYVTNVDSAVLNTGRLPTYIKADIEGAELEMLNGAYNTLYKYKPKLNIALYHRAEDIFRLILKVKEINFGYRMYVRHHPYIPYWDTNLYAI